VADKQAYENHSAYIRENYTSKITLSDIARSVNISTAECCRLFKRNMNISPVEYLINYRVAQSVRLLTDTERVFQRLLFSRESAAAAIIRNVSGS
jgi:AraC-like DNA-binding protein